MQADRTDRTDRQETKPCRTGKTDIHDREIKQANRQTGIQERQTQKNVIKKRHQMIQRRRKDRYKGRVKIKYRKSRNRKRVHRQIFAPAET
jgi:hypothetical protein